MKRIRIDYGIDLGTTNSAIARMENGKPVIKKTDTLKDTMPSCVGFNRRKSVLVGDAALNALKADKLRAIKNWSGGGTNTFIEFKRTMGTDKEYYSTYMERSYNSEELSAEVLKKLRSFISDEKFDSVVITVPAKFDIRQKDATFRAAKLAGFHQVELLQEPIAASMAYGLNAKNKSGFWIVFDFGGGTFDAALIKVEDGIMQVVDTEGDNYLGGKNIDIAIVNYVIIPYLKENFAIDSILADDVKRHQLQEALKSYAEEAKKQLSFTDTYNILSELGDIPAVDEDGNELELDITITRAEAEKIMAPIFQRAIDITKDLLKRNNLTGDRLDALILVGGPTMSPILRRMLEEQIKKPDSSVDPMTAVAVGAALYASTIELTEEVMDQNRDKTKIQLSIGYEASTVETEEWVTLKVLEDHTNGSIPDTIFAEIRRKDKAWSSGKVPIGKKGEVIEVLLNEGKANAFEVLLYDMHGTQLECEPNSFTIIHGSKIGSATLPYNIGVAIKRLKDNKVVFRTAKGLEVNQTLPAKGIINGLKTQRAIRPGNSNDKIKIPIYQGDYYSEGTRAFYNEHVYDAVITGDDLPAFLPENSDVDITLTTDKSGRIERIEAYFPALEFTAEINVPEDVMNEIDSKFLENEIEKAKGELIKLRSDGYLNEIELEKIEEEIMEIERLFEQGRNDYDRKKEVLERLRKVLKKLDAAAENVEWPKFERELRTEFDKLKKANSELGNEESSQRVRELERMVEDVIRQKDTRLGKELLEEIQAFYFHITLIYQLIAIVHYYKNNFHSCNWRDVGRARMLLEQAERIIHSDPEKPNKERLHAVVVELFNELPPEERSRPGDDLDVLMG